MARKIGRIGSCSWSARDRAGAARWTFQGRTITGIRGYLWKLLHFYAASAFGVVFIQTGTIFVATKTIGDGVLHVLGFGISYYLVYFLVGTALLVCWNFFAYNKLIWNRRR